MVRKFTEVVPHAASCQVLDCQRSTPMQIDALGQRQARHD